jgi:DNA-binding MarR family transcriptional regulator
MSKDGTMISKDCTISLEEEIGFRKPIILPPHKALMSIYYTATRLRKRAGEFLRPFGLTDVQFNLLMLLQHQSMSNGGLSQAQLSGMMLVNRADITSLIDRMEKANLVVRTAAPFDRRCNIIQLTDRGRQVLTKIEPLYAKEVRRIMAGLSDKEQTKMMQALEKVRASISYTESISDVKG